MCGLEGLWPTIDRPLYIHRAQGTNKSFPALPHSDPNVIVEMAHHSLQQVMSDKAQTFLRMQDSIIYDTYIYEQQHAHACGDTSKLAPSNVPHWE